MTQPIAVLGARGMLGQAVCAALKARALSFTALSMSAFDARAEKAVREAGAVINCSAWVGAPPGDARLAIQANVLFPPKLYQLNSKLIHISTDGVFSGQSGPYDEQRSPDATDLYGASKALGEPPGAMILRASFVGRSSFSSRHLLEQLQSARRYRAYENHLWNGLTAPTFGQAIAQILADGLFQPGVFHLFGEDMSKAELVTQLVKAFSLSTEVEYTSAPTPCDRRLRTVHDLNQALAFPSFAAQLDELRA